MTDWGSLKYKDGACCKNCGNTKDLTVDHIIPKKWGGTNKKSNLMVLCRKCHNWKEENTVRYLRKDGTIEFIHPMFKYPLCNH